MEIKINPIEPIKLTAELLQLGITGWIDRIVHHDKSHRIYNCFFIVNNTKDIGYISELAHFLLTTGCRNYDFYGKYARFWELCFNNEDKGTSCDDVALTAVWEVMDKFTEALGCTAVECSDYVYDVILLFYDDDMVLKQLLNSLKSWIEDLDDDE